MIDARLRAAYDGPNGLPNRGRGTAGAAPSGADLTETNFRQFFQAHRHISALIGLYNPVIARFDRVAWEYPLFGEFRCDLAIGDSVTKAYTFVEFEDAGPRSLFVKRGDRTSRAWSPRFDHGYSQVVDWFYKLQVMTDSADMEARFGKRSIEYTGVLVVGRDHHLQTGEQLRLKWRREHVIVNSNAFSASPSINSSRT